MFASFVITRPFSCGLDLASLACVRPCVSTLIQHPQTRQEFFEQNESLWPTEIAQAGTKESRASERRTFHAKPILIPVLSFQALVI
jgi:hypothetical protein